MKIGSLNLSSLPDRRIYAADQFIDKTGIRKLQYALPVLLLYRRNRTPFHSVHGNHVHGNNENTDR